jgi:cytochrome c oxidase subunit 2
VSVVQGVVLWAASVSRLVISAADVIHAFTVPALGVKCDAVPGRVRSVLLSVSCSGSLFGQCSEICGSFHGYMPVGVLVVKLCHCRIDEKKIA